MKEYFYTLDLGATYGPKLQQLADNACFDDYEHFAAMILCHAIDAMEAVITAELSEQPITKREESLPPRGSGSKDIDDDIPF